MKRMLTAVLTALLLCLSASALADVTFMDVTVPEDAEYVDFGDAAVTDLDALADFLAQLPAVKRVDMFANQMVKADCDRLAERFPQIRWGWTLLIKGKDHKHLIRTDREILKYCWDLKALDIGHNNVTDLSFLYDLPDLRILILAANQVTDITPLASLKKLEYLEMFKNRVEDLSPLKELTHLMDLNLCNNRVKNLEVLGEMPWLKRLWIYQATGKDRYLRCARRAADNLCSVFGRDGLKMAPGHAVIEMALVRLYELTRDEKYLNECKFFLDCRGLRKFDLASSDMRVNGKYWQDHLPATGQRSAEGHAVRAMYFYSGMADWVRYSGDRDYETAVTAITAMEMMRFTFFEKAQVRPESMSPTAMEKKNG